MQTQRSFIDGIRQLFIIGIPLFYVGVGLYIGWLFIQSKDPVFSSRQGNFLVQGRWQNDDHLRELADLRIDSRFGVMALGQSDAVMIAASDGAVYSPQIVGYRIISSDEFAVEFTHGLTLNFFSFEDGIAVEAKQAEMPYETQQVRLRLNLNPQAEVVEDGIDTRLQLAGQSYVIEGDFDESFFASESSQLVLNWMGELGFDRLNISSNLFGQPRPFEQWLAEDNSVKSERYESALQRYLGRARPHFQQRYNDSNGLWRNSSGADVFNLAATLTRIDQAQDVGSRNNVLQRMREQNLINHAQYPLWLAPWSGQLASAWTTAQRNFATQERLWTQQASGDSNNLFTQEYYYTEVALAAPLLIPRLTTLARTVRREDSSATIIFKIRFLMDALVNQNSRENLQAIQRQLEALESRLVFLKKGIYLMQNEQLETLQMLRYALLLHEIEQRGLDITYRQSRPLDAMRESLILGALEFTNAQGEVAEVADWNNGRPQASDTFVGLEYFNGLFSPRAMTPTVHFAVVGREQRVLSAAQNVVIRTLSQEVIELRVESKERFTHQLVLTSLIRPVVGVSIGSRRLLSSSTLEQVAEGYTYDAARRMVFIKVSQALDSENIRVTIEPPPPPPPVVIEEADGKTDNTAANASTDSKRKR